MKVEELESILVSLDGMSVSLESVPTPAGLQVKTKQVRDLLTRARRALTRVQISRSRREQDLLACKASFDLEFARLLSEDREVRDGGSVTDRKSLARWKLRDKSREITEKERVVLQFVSVEKAVLNVVRDLEGTNRDLARQRHLLAFDESLAPPSSGSVDEHEDVDEVGEEEEWQALLDEVNSDLDSSSGGEGGVDGDDRGEDPSGSDLPEFDASREFPDEDRKGGEEDVRSSDEDINAFLDDIDVNEVDDSSSPSVEELDDGEEDDDEFSDLLMDV